MTQERDFEADMLPLHEGGGQTSSLPALETYADDTYGSLLQLALECSDSGSDVASEAARFECMHGAGPSHQSLWRLGIVSAPPYTAPRSFVGRAQGMSILLRAIPPLLQRGTLRLPPDVCAKVRRGCAYCPTPRWAASPRPLARAPLSRAPLPHHCRLPHVAPVECDPWREPA